MRGVGTRYYAQPSTCAECVVYERPYVLCSRHVVVLVRSVSVLLVRDGTLVSVVSCITRSMVYSAVALFGRSRMLRCLTQWRVSLRRALFLMQWKILLVLERMLLSVLATVFLSFCD